VHRGFEPLLGSRLSQWLAGDPRSRAVGVWKRGDCGIGKDVNGGLIYGASATARNEETGLERAAVTDDRGRFSMLAMPVGRYEIKASANGFEAVTRTGITLAVGETAVVEITLQPASISARADVKAEPQPLDSQTNSSGSIIAERAVMDLPARGRNFSE